MAAATLGDVAVRVRADTSGLKGDIAEGTQGAADKAESDLTAAGGRTGSKYGGAFARAAKVGILGLAAAGAAAGVVIVKALTGGFNRLKAIDTAKAKLRGLGFQGEKLKKVMDAAANSVDGTAFGLDAAATAAGTLAAAGVGIGDMEGTLKNVANLASVIGSDMQYASMIFGEVAAQGKITGNVLTQMEQAGFGATAALAEGLGKTRAEIKDLAKTGQISAEQFNEAMRTKLGGAALEIGKSWEGVMANIKTRISKLGAQVLEPTFERLKGVATRFNEFLNELVKTGAFTGFGDRLAAEFDKVHAAMKRILPTGDQVKEFLAGLAPDKPLPTPGVGTVLGRQDSPQGVRSMPSAVQGAVSPLQGAATPTGMEKAGMAIKDAFAAIMKVVTPAWNALKSVFSKGMKEIGPLLSQLGNVITTQFLPAFEKIMPILGPIVGFLLKILGGAVIGMIKGIIKVITGVVQVVSGIINLLYALFTGDWAGAWEAFKNILSGVLNIVIGIIQFFWNFGIVAVFKKGFLALGGLLKSGWNAIVNFFKTGTKTVTAHLDLAWALIKQSFSKLWEGLKSGAVAGWSAISKFFSTIKTSVIGFFKGAGTWLLNIGKDIINGLINGIKTASSAVKKAVDWIVNHIPSWAKAILGIGSPSKVMAEQVGRWIPAGMAEGIESGMGVLNKAVQGMAGDVTIGAVSGVPRAPGRAQGSTPAVNSSTTNSNTSNLTYAPNFFGPTTGADRKREWDWTAKYAPRVGAPSMVGAH